MEALDPIRFSISFIFSILDSRSLTKSLMSLLLLLEMPLLIWSEFPLQLPLLLAEKALPPPDEMTRLFMLPLESPFKALSMPFEELE